MDQKVNSPKDQRQTIFCRLNEKKIISFTYKESRQKHSFYHKKSKYACRKILMPNNFRIIVLLSLFLTNC